MVVRISSLWFRLMGIRCDRIQFFASLMLIANVMPATVDGKALPKKL